LVDGQHRFTSDHIHPVLTRGAGRWVEIPLRAVGGSGPRPTDDGRRSETAPPKPIPAPEPASIPAHGLRLPATFRGDLPCADCEAVRHHLDLWPDQVFHLQREWLGKEPIGGSLEIPYRSKTRRAMTSHCLKPSIFEPPAEPARRFAERSNSRSPTGQVTVLKQHVFRGLLLLRNPLVAH
jgi:hypothetical protein